MTAELSHLLLSLVVENVPVAALSGVNVTSSGSVLRSAVRSNTNVTKVASDVVVNAIRELNVDFVAVPVRARVRTTRVTSLIKKH